MVSPELKQSFILSSSTVFIFSIHKASTGPLNIIHFLVGVPLLEHLLNIEANIPSFHSFVITSA